MPNLESANSVSDSHRCIKDAGTTDGATLLERLFGETHKIHKKQIVSNNDQNQVNASQDIHVSKAWHGVLTSVWPATQFNLDGKSYEVENKGKTSHFTEQGKRQIEDTNSPEYKRLMSAYEQVSSDFRHLPKCTISGLDKTEQ